MPVLRHLLLLTSVQPDFSHSKAGRTVCALLAEELKRHVEQVTIGMFCPTEVLSGVAAERLASAGVAIVNLPGRWLERPASSGRLDTLAGLGHSLVLDNDRFDFPRPDNATAMAAAIDNVGADVALLFWDTLTEFALPHMKTSAFGYIARPPYAAGVARTQAAAPGLRRSMTLAQFAAQERRHLRRMRRLRGSANICALDAAYYASHDVRCSYVSNTWNDPVGPDWSVRRSRAEAAANAVQILANIGALDATGNSFGMRYLGAEVMPILSEVAVGSDWSVSICGQNQPTPDVAKVLRHPRIKIKGFVDDIDEEVLSSAIFLLLNNAGPYTGGYTRVVYACATGGCLIAHSNLRNSMPELVSGQNCLLGDTPSGIADQIKRALDDVGLRRRIGAAARETYETQYAPRQVASKLVRMITHNLYNQPGSIS